MFPSDNANVSHACLTPAPLNNKCFYDNTKHRDVVKVVNTVGPTVSGTDGSATGTFLGTAGAGNAAVAG